MRESNSFEEMRAAHYKALAQEVQEAVCTEGVDLGLRFDRLIVDRHKLFNYAVFAINDMFFITDIAIPEQLVDKDFLVLKLTEFWDLYENDPDFNPEWYDRY
ncbi:hypothetical protein [Exiguobacterium aurantiacum]|uniref:hypothetical protein n=1 Tax=Exiguobacterium aurantiacum TaxID=33987 RepID=UPI00384D33D4